MKNLKWYIDKYGEIEGKIKHQEINKTKINNLENFIRRHGKDEGTKKYLEYKEKLKNRFTKKWFIEKYGDEEGIKKYEEKNKKSAGSLDAFIGRHGKKIGTIKYNEFRKKCVVKDEIKQNPDSKYNNRKFATTLKYWIEKCNGNIDEAKIKLKNRQNTSSLDKFIKKYGEDEGTKKYIETCRKKLWKDGRYSRISQEFIETLIKNITEFKFKKIYYGENEYVFLLNEKDLKLAKPDCYIKDINLIIEFYGDYFHRNPKIYNNIIDNKKYEIWERDNKRIKLIKEKYNCDVIIIWESDYKLNEKDIIEQIKIKIKEKINGNI